VRFLCILKGSSLSFIYIFEHKLHIIVSLNIKIYVKYRVCFLIENRFSEDFLEIRRSALESFLRWLQWIPELSESAEFLSFCTTQSSVSGEILWYMKLFL
jgi:hypothetical protein